MFLWITPFQTQKKVVWAMISVCFVWLVTSLFLEGFTCHGLPDRCQSYVRDTFLNLIMRAILTSLLTVQALAIYLYLRHYH